MESEKQLNPCTQYLVSDFGFRFRLARPARGRPARPAGADRAGEQWWETEARDLKEQLKMARNGPMSGNPGHWDYRTGDRQRHAEPKR